MSGEARPQNWSPDFAAPRRPRRPALGTAAAGTRGTAALARSRLATPVQLERWYRRHHCLVAEEIGGPRCRGDVIMHVVPGWHPMIVHFPLALIATAAFCLTLSRLLPAPRRVPALAIVGTWNLCLGAVAVFFALGSGLAAVIGLQVGLAAHE